MSQRGAIAIKYFTPSGLSIGQPHLSSHICDVGRKRVKGKSSFIRNHCLIDRNVFRQPVLAFNSLYNRIEKRLHFEQFVVVCVPTWQFSSLILDEDIVIFWQIGSLEKSFALLGLREADFWTSMSGLQAIV